MSGNVKVSEITLEAAHWPYSRLIVYVVAQQIAVSSVSIS